MTTVAEPGFVSEVLYASPGRRATAFVLDLVFALALATVPMALLIAGLLSAFPPNDDETTRSMPKEEARQKDLNPIQAGVLELTVLIPAFLYDIVATAKGGGWGKRLLGLRVVRQEDGSTPGWRAAVIRSLAKLLLIFFWFVGVFAVVGAFRDSRRKTWWDISVDTVVIRV